MNVTVAGTVRVRLLSVDKTMEELGLNKGGRAQQKLDNVILQTCDPYIPLDTGTMRNSGPIHTVIGSGIIIWQTPYVRKQYYENKGGEGLRGKLWFERAKASHLSDWAQVVADVSGGRVKLF